VIRRVVDSPFERSKDAVNRLEAGWAIPGLPYPPMITERRFDTVRKCTRAAAWAMVAELRAAVRDRGAATLAVSGGRTAKHVLPFLAVSELAWHRVTVTLADDRWVRRGHPDSNEGLARRYLLKDRAAKAAFVRLKTVSTTPAAGLKQAESWVRDMEWPLDVIFLGMGEDGHVASLFPGEDWSGGKRLVAVPATDGRQPRGSLSPSALVDVRHVFLVISGAAKTETYVRACEPGPAEELPVRLVLHQDRVPVSVFLAS